MASRKQLSRSLLKTSAVTTAKTIGGPLGGVAAQILFDLQDFQQSRTRERAGAFVEQFLESGTPAETAAPEFETNFKKAPKDTKEVLFHSLKTLSEAVVDECIAPLALLAREYVSTGSPRDRFFINMCRLLRELTTAGQLRSLRELAHAIDASWRSPDHDSMNLERLGPNAVAVGRAKLGIDDAQEFDDLWRLLGDCHLVETHLETGSGGATTWGGRQTSSAARNTWSRVLRLLP